MAASTGRRKKCNRANEVPGLEDEIRLLREIIQRAAAMAEEDRAVMDLVRLWGAAGRACGQLSGLLKTERALGALRDANAELDQALHEALDELNAFRREHPEELE